MREEHLKLIDAILEDLNAADESNYVVRIHDVIERVARLARECWNESLWRTSAYAWAQIREILGRVERINRENEATEWWWESGGNYAEVCGFLASQATNAEHPPQYRKKAEVMLNRVLSNEIKQNDPGLELLIRLAVGRPRSTPVPNPAQQPSREGKVAPVLFKLVAHEVPEAEPSTLTALSAGGVEIDDSFYSFDKEVNPQKKREALCRLQSIGGCTVSQGLSSRLHGSEQYVQCWILRVLAELALKPYREGDHSEPPRRQLETAKAVLKDLRELGDRGTTSCIGQAVKAARESVEFHLTQLGSGE